MKRERCCDLLACRDRSFCGCCLPTTTGDARRLKWVGVFIGIIALIFLLIGLFVPTAISNAFETALINSATIAQGTDSFDLMASNHEFPMKLELYLYNVTNPAETMDGAKPSLKELGPFVYWVYRDILDDYEFVESNSRLNFQYYERYIFDEKLSVASDDALIYQANMPFWGVANAFLMKGLGQMLHDFSEQVATDEKYNKAYEDPMNKVWAYRSIRESLFGYPDDPFMNCISDNMGADFFSPIYTGIMQNYTSPADARARLPVNETISTGISDAGGSHSILRDQARHYVNYRGANFVQDLEKTGACPWGKPTDMICTVHGIDGASTVPLTNRTNVDQGFDFFYPSLFRTIHFDFENKYEEEGINFFRFRFDPKEWQDKVTNPTNEAYGMDVSGIIPLSKALSKSPVSIGRPRQLGVSDEAYFAGIDVEFIDDGKRDPEDPYSMDTHFDMEQRSGSTLRFSSTSEMIITIGKMEFEYDDWFILLNVDQIKELDTFVQEQQALAAGVHNNDLDIQSINLSPLIQLMTKFDTQNTLKYPHLSSKPIPTTSPLQFTTQQQQQQQQLHTTATSQEELDLFTQPQPQLTGGLAQPCGFSPNSQHCTGTASFQKLSQIMTQNKAQFNLQQEQEDENNLTEIKKVQWFTTLGNANVPFFWANQTGGINQHDLKALGSAFAAVDNTVKVLPIVCFPLAIFLLLIGAFFMIRGSQYQSELRDGASHLDETHQDGSIVDKRYATGNGADYGDTLDALDLDPVYSNDYSTRTNNAAASSLHISQGSRPMAMGQSATGYNRSYSTTSNSRKLLNRDRSFEPLTPGRSVQGYGGIELKGPDRS